MEDNPLKAKQRKDRDISTLSAEMRQMEEQFTIYDFRQMHRRSYYPHNQPITNGVHQEESEASEITQSTTNTLVPTSTWVDHSRPNSPINEDDAHRHMHHRQSLYMPTQQTIPSVSLHESHQERSSAEQS